jgi:hypothetical protein
MLFGLQAVPSPDYSSTGSQSWGRHARALFGLVDTRARFIGMGYLVRTRVSQVKQLNYLNRGWCAGSSKQRACVSAKLLGTPSYWGT